MISFRQIHILRIDNSLFAGTHFVLDLVDQLSRLLVAGDVKEHHHTPEDAVENGEDAVHGRILFVLSDGAADKAGEGERENDEEGPLADGCRRLLCLVCSLQCWVVVSCPGGLYQGEGGDHQDQYGDVLSVHQPLVHLKPAVVSPSVVVVLEAHVEEDDEGGHSPADDDVLLGCQHSVLLDDAGHQSVQVDPLQEHEGEADSEEVVYGDGDDLAVSDGPAVEGVVLLTEVEGGQEADVGTQQGELLAHVDDSTRCPDTEAEEEDQGDAEKGDDESAGALAEASRHRLDCRLHGGGGTWCWGGGWRHDAAAVVRLHHSPHLTDALYHGVLRGAPVSQTLRKLGTLVSEARVGAVGVVPELRVVGVVSPGVTSSGECHN